MDRLLSDLELNRRSWISEGIEEYRSGFLRVDTASVMEMKEKRVLIGVYGPTQAGKTTVILKVLGIRDHLMRQISDALRGGRKKGFSATVTASIFQCSKTEFFEVSAPGMETVVCVDLAELQDCMSELRNRVIESAAYSLEPVVIRIPLRFFDKDELRLRQQQIEVLDLPGDDSADVRERRHVENCLREYLPQCRVTLLVEIASKMVNLQQIDRESIREWPHRPSLFRIVFTRSAADSSMKRAIRTGNINNEEEYIRHLAEQLHKELPAPARSILVYPLDLGDSLSDLKDREITLYETIQRWNQSIYRRLIDDLSTVHTPDNEIDQWLDLRDEISSGLNEEVARLEREIRNAMEEEQDLNLRIQSTQASIQVLNRKEMELNRVKGEILGLTIPSIALPSIAPYKQLTSAERNKDALLASYWACVDQMENHYRSGVQRLNRDIRLRLDPYLRKVPQIELDFDKSEAAVSFPFSLIPLIFKGAFESHYAIVRDQLVHIKHKNDEKLASVLQKITEQGAQILSNHMRVLVINRDDLKEQRAELEKQLRDQQGETERLQSELREAREQWDADLKRSETFFDYLKQAVLRQMQHYLSMIQSPGSPPYVKWANHHYLNLLYKDAERRLGRAIANRN